MDTKHYGAAYLTDTGEFLKQLKIQSYTPFLAIEQGVIADLGCGTGMDAIHLADMLAEKKVQIVGIDHDSLLIAQAESAKESRHNISFKQGEVDQLDFENSSLSGIRMERVIQHLLQPGNMFDEVYRVLRPGQPFVITETIWNSLNFYTNCIEVEEKIRKYLTCQKVNNGWAGNKLTADLASHGFKDIKLQTYCMVVRSKEEANRYLFLEHILSEMIEQKILSHEEVVVFMEALELANKNGYFISSINMVIARATK